MIYNFLFCTHLGSFIALERTLACYINFVHIPCTYAELQKGLIW